MARKSKLPFDPDEAPYDVGYGKPPENTRFKPGKSGNPSGRPKRRQPPPSNIHEIVLQEAARKVKVGDGTDQSITMQQAAIRSAFVQAAKGNARAQQTVVKLQENAENFRRQCEQAEIASMSDDELHESLLEAFINIFGKFSPGKQNELIRKLRAEQSRGKK